MILKFLLLTWSSLAFSVDYQLIDFLANQRTVVPQSHLEMKIESQHRVNFNKLACSEWKGVFTDYLIPEGESSLRFHGKNTKITKKTLHYLKNNSPNARKLIKKLLNSPHKIYIQESKGNSFLNLRVFDEYEHNNAYAVTILEKSSLYMEDHRVPLSKLGGSSLVTWNPTRAKTTKLRAITLAHELYHAYDAARGMLDYRLVSGSGYESTAVTEYRGVYFENLVRKDLGMKRRIKYSENSAGTLKNRWIDRPCLKGSL